MNSFEIAVKSNQLPTMIEDLLPLSFIGNEAVKFYQSKIKLLDQLGMTEEQKKITLRDGQDAGIMLLNIEARIGELLPTGSLDVTGRINFGKKTEFPKGYEPKSKKVFIARSISANPTIVQEVIQQAIENEDIPTKTAVLNEIKYRKEKARQAETERNRPEKSEVKMKIEEQIYITELERVINILPKEPPQDWSKEFFDLACDYWRIIAERGKHFGIKYGVDNIEPNYLIYKEE